jgi:hypothetical protein
MMTLLLSLGFLLLQALILVAAIVCYVHRRLILYYGVLYLPVAGFAMMVRIVGGDDWIVVLVIQALLSLNFNLQISSNKI